jgi:branched-chain amino acid transport system substrate-binding protein
MPSRDFEVRRRRLLHGVAASLGSFNLPGLLHAAERGVGVSEVLIGQSVALQGGKSLYAAEVMAGVATQFDAVNKAGGVSGRRLVLRTLDDDNTSAKAEANARRLVDEGVFMLFGSVEGGPSTAVATVASAQQVPFFGPMAGSPGMRRPHLPMVFPVRAEHREEFRALLRWATDIGLPYKQDIDDGGIGALVDRLRNDPVEIVLNHGSAGVYERLIRRAREVGLGVAFAGVNSGATELAASLGPLAQGMVFSQVMPSPWARKTALTREYQAALAARFPGRTFSYGSLEGYATAKALVAVLRQAGSDLTRSSLLRALRGGDFDLGGLRVRYRNGDHEGSTFVDLAMVTREGRFLQ